MLCLTGLYFTSVVNAVDDNQAIEGFVQNMNNKQYSVETRWFRSWNRRFHLTYEELDNGTTGVNIEKSYSWSPNGLRKR